MAYISLKLDIIISKLHTCDGLKFVNKMLKSAKLTSRPTSWTMKMATCEVKGILWQGRIKTKSGLMLQQWRRVD